MLAIFFILIAVILRIAPYVSVLSFIPHIPNFAPVAAMALFSGVYLNKKYALIVPLVAMGVSDYFIGTYDWTVMLSVYGSFIVVALLGLWLRKHKTIANTAIIAVGGSILFFIVTNFAVWASPNFFYPHTIQGLMQSYIMGLPFFRNTLLGDLFYVSVFFGVYELITYLAKRRKTCPIRSRS